MSPTEAVQAAYRGNLVECSKEEYPEVRRVLQEAAGKMLDQSDHIRASIMLSEVQRLDTLHDFSLLTKNVQ